MNIVDQFKKDGCVFPLEIFSKEEISYYRSLIEHEVDKNDILKNEKRCKSLLLYPWLDEIVHNEKILNYVSQILGNNFFCWDTQCWLKEPESTKFVSCHQDATYWNFKQKKGVIVWLAFNDIEKNQGPVQYWIGSHEAGQLIHDDYKSPDNYLRRGQTVIDSLSNYKMVECLINAGSISIHHPYIVHGSLPNTSNKRRIAYSLQYISTDNEPIITDFPEYGTLVSGVDKYNYIKHSPRPTINIEHNIEHWKIALNSQISNHSKIKLP